MLRIFLFHFALLLFFGAQQAMAQVPPPPGRLITVGPWEDYEEAELSGQVTFVLDDYAGDVVVRDVQNAAVEIEGGYYSQLIVYTARGENSFSAADGSQSTLDFRNPESAGSVGSGSIGSRDTGTIFTFGDNGSGDLLILLRDITGGDTAGQATVINIHDDAYLRQSYGGSVTGQVHLNFNGTNFQNFDGFYNFGQADLSSSLVIGGTNSAPAPDGESATVVNIANIHGGRNGQITAITANGSSAGSVDYLFSTSSPIQGGAFAFYYNGTTAQQGNSLSIGAADDDTTVIIGGSNDQATVRLSDLKGGEGEYATSLVVLDGQVKVSADTVQNNVNIINNNAAAGAVILENVQDGALNLGGTGSNIVLQWVNAAAEGLTINSLNGQYATVEAAALGNESGFSNNSKISLGNARLVLAEDGSGLNFSSAGSRLALDSSTGDSILDASRVSGDFAFGLGRQPTLTVGGGGQVIIENNNLVYQSALASGPGPARAAEDFDGRLHFEGAGENRLIFLSRGQNTFEGGFKIDDSAANIEFVGSSFLSGFTENGDSSQLKAGHIFFTGLDNTADPLAASRISFGNGFIEMGGSPLHLNNSLLLSQASGQVGGLGQISSLILGDGQGIMSGAPANVTLLDTSLSAERASIGGQGARLNAAVAIGGSSVMENSLNISGTLEIGGRTVINGHLATLANGETPAFYFTARESIQLTNAAQFSYIDPGTIFMIDEALADILRDSGEGLEIFKAAEGALEISQMWLASLAANLVFSDTNLREAGDFDLNPFTGILSQGQGGAQGRALPAYARPMIEAAPGLNPLLGQYLLRGPGLSARRHQEELAMLMGNTMNAALNLGHSSADEALGRLRQIAALAGPLPAAGNPAFRITDGLWLSAAMGRFTIDENYRAGFSEARAKNSGLTVGYDLEGKRYLRAGLFAGLNLSEMKLEWQTIESEAVEAGAYAQAYLPWGFILGGVASYAWQQHTSRRDIDLRGTLGESFDQKLSANFSGDSINFQAELKRPIAPGGNFQISPAIAYIYQGALLEPFLEESSRSDNPQFNLATISAGTDFNLHQIKAGAEASWQGDDFALNARVHSVHNLGDLRPESQAVFACSADPKIFTMYGAELDKQMLNVGLGIDWSPEEKPFAVALDYEGILGNNTKSHSLSVSLSYNF